VPVNTVKRPDLTIDHRRGLVVAEAESWLSTPYHHMGRVKGVGVDCLTLLAEVYERAGIAPHLEIPFYPPDWNLHRDAERYLEGIMGYAREIEGPPLPGDIALFRFGRCFAHGVIVVEWPRLIHAWADTNVLWGSADQSQLAGRKVRFFSPF
jgi:cell wall-associated NlpC family hydrolase